MKITLTILLVLTAFVLGMGVNSGDSISPKGLVYQICQQSRTSNYINEKTCGDLQDYLSIEYLCKDLNNLPTNHCWVEVNKDLGKE